MSWRTYLADTITGLIAEPIDIPSFGWSVEVSNCSLSTTRDKGTGEGEASSITVPWSAVPGSTSEAVASAVSSSRRALVLCWHEDGTDVAVVAGAIGQRTDTQLDTSFSLDSFNTLLSSRICIAEGAFGTDEGSTSKGQTRYEKMSLRGIAANVGYMCTELKPGGSLPIDWQYLDEAGGHERTYMAYNAGNLSCSDIWTKISNVIGGPDIQLRPYITDDGSHFRMRFEAGSDADVYLGNGHVHRLSCFPGGGTLEEVSVAHLGPVSRVYATGAGSEDAQLCHLSEDLTLQRTADPWPLVEEAWGSSDDEKDYLLRDHADARLAAERLPVMQLSGYIDLGDPAAPRPGTIWPGEEVEVAIDGFPTLPDGIYRLRLMRMEGDEGNRVKLTFDPCRDPIY